MADVNITATYDGTEKYTPSNTNITIPVGKQDTSVIFDDIEDIISGETATITGQLVDGNGIGFYGTVKLLINNGRATVKTDKEGYFTYTTTLTKVGINNITASYLGGNRYGASEANITVEVMPMDTTITLDAIQAVKKGENITVSGKVLDENGNPVSGTVKLIINNGRATVKTDFDGVFMYDFTANRLGTTNITASYIGGNRYFASYTNSTVTVTSAGTNITLKPLGTVTQKTNVDITGQLNDEFGNGIYGTVKLLINNGRATVKTDVTGAFTYTYNATRAGENTIKANYLESANYQASEVNSTFTVVKA